MTGYRADLTGFFDYSADQASELKPLSGVQRYYPSMILTDGDRDGLSESSLMALSRDLGMNKTEPLFISELRRGFAMLKSPLVYRSIVSNNCQSFTEML